MRVWEGEWFENDPIEREADWVQPAIGQRPTAFASVVSKARRTFEERHRLRRFSGPVTLDFVARR